MKQYIFPGITLAALSVLASCGQDLELTDAFQSEPQTTQLGERGVRTDLLRVRFTTTVADQIQAQLAQGTTQLQVDDEQINTFLQEVGANSVRRLFPYNPKFDRRHREAGLHQWYEIELNPKANNLSAYEQLDRALNIARRTEGVEVAEEARLLTQPASELVVDNEAYHKTRSLQNVSGFNDERLVRQWHYYNDGSVMRSVAQADINLAEAWKIETGKSNVVVAIVDGGVDFQHEDLKDNMYVNVKERDGLPGVDDDGNGVIDDVYGYNFVTQSGTITPHPHGTHVAGTVAARNNNGVGVAGIAGGDGSEGSGVRLMSCQMFHENEEGRTLSSGGAVAIVYGADNGAVISQNSWGYTLQGTSPVPLAEVDKAAIDYFVKYAGCDSLGNQLPDSPMKGGVVIFAAGNDGLEYQAYPGAYDGAIAVASMAPDFTAAYYSNRGTWVDIMAPGGSVAFARGSVYSTLPNNKYGFMQGTSMACPHVSGVAALIVSKFGGQGFTNEELKRRLLTAVRDQNIYTYNADSKFENRLGTGFIDAAKALAEVGDNQSPDAVKAIYATSTHTGVRLAWEVATDANDGTAFDYLLYYSTDPLTESNYHLALSTRVNGSRIQGDSLYNKHTDLLPNTDYHYAVVAVDRWGKESEKPAFASVRTATNRAPQLTLLDATPIRLQGDTTATRQIQVTEPDGHAWTYAIEGESYDVQITPQAQGILELRFRVSRPIGKYKVRLVVTDELGLETKMEVPFEIYRHVAPKWIGATQKFFAVAGKTTSLNLNQYFHDDNTDETLTYVVRSLDADLITATVEGQTLQLAGRKAGLAGLEITATDPTGLKTTVGLSVQVSNHALVHAVTPTITTHWLQLAVAELPALRVLVTTPSGKVALPEQIYDTRALKGHLRLDVSGLPAGTYVLVAETNDERFTQTFIKR